MLKSLVFALLLILFSLLCLAAGEYSLRIFKKLPAEFTLDERNLFYQKDDLLGWFPRPNSRGKFKGNREFSVAHNNFGFRDLDYVSDQRPKIAVLGDSFTWGYDVEYSERFTQILEKKYKNWQWLNWGVSGYGTDQELLLLKQSWPIWKPKIVILIVCSENDQDDSATNWRYGGYYKPYFEFINGELVLRGVPVPDSIRFKARNYPKIFQWRLLAEAYRFYWQLRHPILHFENLQWRIIGEMNSYLRERGVKFYVALTASNLNDTKELQKLGIDPIVLDRAERFPYFGKHWTIKGNQDVAAILQRKLRLQ